MEATVNKPFNRFDIPVKWGVIIALINIVLFTILNMFLLGSMITYYICLFLAFVLTIVLFGVMAAKQRKAKGGYISFKDAFGAIFISILIVSVVSFIYSLLYTNVIDPDFQERLKDATLRFTEQMGAPQESIDEAAAAFDEQMEKRQSFGSQLLGLLWSIVLYSIFGFICAAIVKRKKPADFQLENQG